MEKKNALFIIDDGYQEIEFWYPYIRLKEEGFNVISAGLSKKTYHGLYGYPATVDMKIEDCSPENFDVVIITGGKSNIKRLEQTQDIIEFVKKFYNMGRYIAAVYYGILIIAHSGIAYGKSIASNNMLKYELSEYGVIYLDSPVVVDDKIITSRSYADLPQFCSTIISFMGGV
ncbi:MAG: DJ-1/PfpI family protein [Thermoplasmata archaeon]